MQKVKIGVIGVGGIGCLHCRNIKTLEDIELTCVCDVNEQAVEKVGEEFHVKYFSDYKKLIKSGLCDAVLVATPHWFHPEICVFAFENGLHVLCEKPMAVTVSGADRMIEAAKKSKKVFSLMYQQRISPAVQKAIGVVKSGILGQIQRTLFIDTVFYRTQAYYDSATWRATWKGEGGGVLMNQAPHGIDIFLSLAGLPRKVEAKTRTKLHEIEVEDEVSAFLEYENGAWGYYYTGTCEAGGGLRAELLGDKGKLVLIGEELKLYTFTPSISQYTFKSKELWSGPEVKEEKVEILSPKENIFGHAGVVKNFARAILYKEPLMVSGEEGVKSIEFINALIMSGRKCVPVGMPVNRKEYDNFMEALKKDSKHKRISA
ncbi:MAG: Gfo/Idh/MocA family oxidoreductase [Candidatus Ratteibacteria bacterium]|nr:Gfo/Idh/MocA family oxidoreductase [Candidatus Ratteibacteria bacterium]